MPANGSITGLAAALREAAVGDLVTISVKADPGETADPFLRFRNNVSAKVAYIARETSARFTLRTVDALLDDGATAVRCAIVERLS